MHVGVGIKIQQDLCILWGRDANEKERDGGAHVDTKSVDDFCCRSRRGGDADIERTGGVGRESRRGLAG